MRKKEFLIGTFTGLGLGAGLMFFFDPARGKYRRTRVNDKASHYLNKAGAEVDHKVTDFGHRIHGLFARLAAIFESPEASDEILVERVRARLGHITRHAHAIEVYAEQGQIVLSGVLPVDEVEMIGKAAAKVRGVNTVENRLAFVLTAKTPETDETKSAA